MCKRNGEELAQKDARPLIDSEVESMAMCKTYGKKLAQKDARPF